jgi:hypothetical protein
VWTETFLRLTPAPWIPPIPPKQRPPTDSTTAPQIARTQTCARASVVGRGTGVGEAFASVAAGAVKVGAAACGDAVSNAVSGLCAGADPMATIFGVTQACASALADVYTRAVTNATVLPVEDPTGWREQQLQQQQEEQEEQRERQGAGSSSSSSYASSSLWWPALKGPNGGGAAADQAGGGGQERAGGAAAAAGGDQAAAAGERGQKQSRQQQQQQQSVLRRGYLTACASGCANAQASAEAFAQAAACGVAKGTDSCAAAMAQVKTRAFSSAFVKTAAAAWSSACARGYGRAAGGGEQVAQAAAASIAKVTAQLAATACSTCANCKCKPLPKGFDWSDPSDYASASASLADGRTVVAKAAASATVAFCESPSDLKPKALNASVDGVLDALAEVLTTASGNMSAASTAQGGVGNAWACGGVSLAARLGAAKDAYGAAVQDAAALVFGGWCPKAAARMTKLAAVNQDLTESLIEESLESCSEGFDAVEEEEDGGGGGGAATAEGGGGSEKSSSSSTPVGGTAPSSSLLPENLQRRKKTKTIKSVVSGHKPWVDAVHDALTDAEACGCRAAPLCLTCTTQADRLAAVAERLGKAKAADALRGILAPEEEEEVVVAVEEEEGEAGTGVEKEGEGGVAGGGPDVGAARDAAAAALSASRQKQAGLDLTALAARAARAAEGSS